MNKLIITLFFILLLCACGNTQKAHINSYPKQVGDIAFDKNIDDSSFKVCNEERMFQYYNFSKGLQYKGEKIKIIEHFKQYFQQNDTSQCGYITIRFIVNCEGKTGRFRVQEMDNNYKPANFNKALIAELLKLTQQLDGWEVGVYEKHVCDYYQYLTFKLNNGAIEEIMP